MDYINNKGEKIGSLTVSISKDKSVTINRLNDVTTVTVRDRNTGKVDLESRKNGTLDSALLNEQAVVFSAQGDNAILENDQNGR